MRLIDADELRDIYTGVPNGLYTTGHIVTAIDECKTVDATTVAKDIKVPNKWVSVKDRMPKDGQDVLAYLNYGEETRIAPCNYYNGVWYDSVMNCVVVLQDVTHWMPLPEPPKEDKDD